MVLFYSQTTHSDRSSCRHCLPAVKCLLSPLVAISQKKGSAADWWPAELSLTFKIFCISFNTAQIASHGMHLSSHLSLILYLQDLFLIFNGLMIKYFLAINNVNCQMPVRWEIMSESEDFFFPCGIIILVFQSKCIFISHTHVTR